MQSKDDAPLPIDPVGDVTSKIDARSPWTPYPVHFFPGVFCDYVVASAKDMEADPGAVANLFLGMISGVIGSRWFLKVHANGGDYRQPAYLWCSNVIRSGGNKSGVMNSVTKVATWIDQAVLEQSIKSIREYQVELSNWEADLPEKRKEWRNMANLEMMRRDRDLFMLAKPEAPRRRKLISIDSTLGATQVALKSNPRGILHVFDEMRGWLASMGQFSSSPAAGAGEKAAWLTLGTGGPIVVDRKHGDCFTIPFTGCSIIANIQTTILGKMMTEEDLENGLLTRILCVMPPERLRMIRLTVSSEAIDLRIGIYSILKSIFDDEGYKNDPPAGQSSIDEELERDKACDWKTHPEFWITPEGTRDLCLSAASLAMFVEWQNKIEKAKYREPNELIKSLYPKIESFTLRFALIHHVLIRAISGDLKSESMLTIEPESTALAIELGEWYLQEQCRVYAEVIDTPVDKDHTRLKKLFEWIERQTGPNGEYPEGVTPRDCYNAFRWKASITKQYLDQLCSGEPSSALLIKRELVAENGRPTSAYSINSQRKPVDLEDIPE